MTMRFEKSILSSGWCLVFWNGIVCFDGGSDEAVETGLGLQALGHLLGLILHRKHCQNIAYFISGWIIFTPCYTKFFGAEFLIMIFHEV